MNDIDALVRNYINTALQNDSLNQSYIFEGAAGTGRLELAMHTAKALLCTDNPSKSKPCGSCHACKLIESGNHPDYRVVTHEKPTVLSVKEIREQVVEDINIKPYYGGRKIYIIPDAELMGDNGQNALLKTIEEPPEYALIILITTNKELLLQTIQSRCVTLSFRAEPEFHPKDEALQAQFDKIEDIVSGRSDGGIGELMMYAYTLSSGYKEYLPQVFSHIEKICRDALFMKSGIDLTEEASASYIEGAAEISYEGLERILKSVQTARHDIKRNVAMEAVLESLLLHIMQARRSQTNAAG